METAAVDEIKKVRPEQRSWSDVVIHCINHSLYFRLLNVIKVNHVLNIVLNRGLHLLKIFFFTLHQ